MDRLFGESKNFFTTAILGASDLPEGSHNPFNQPTIVRASVDFGLPRNEHLSEISKTILYCHSNIERGGLTVGEQRVSVQKLLDNFVSVHGLPIDFVVVCNPHKVKLKNCGAYIEGSPTTLLSNQNGELLLSVVSVCKKDEFKLIKP